MKIFYKTRVLLLLTMVCAQGLFGQATLDLTWTKVDGIPVSGVEAISQKGDSLFAFTQTGIYASVDFGDTWELVKDLGFNEKDFLVNRDSMVVFRAKYPDLEGDQCGEDTTWQRSEVLFFDGQELRKKEEEYKWTYYCVVVHHFEEESLSKGPAILSDGHIIYNKYMAHCYGTCPAALEESRKFYEDFQVVDYQITTYLLGQWSGQWIDKYLPGLANFEYIGTSMDTVSKLFAASANGVMRYTLDKGSTWNEQAIPQGAINYFMKDEFHVLITESDVYTSLDGLNFSALTSDIPQGEATRFWIFGEFIMVESQGEWFRSFDKGNTWEAFEPKGIAVDEIEGLSTYQDTVYVKANGQWFQHNERSKFKPLENPKPFLNNLQEGYVVTENGVIFSGNKKHDGSNWLPNNLDVNVHHYFLDDQRVYAIPTEGNKVYFSDDEGATWGSVFCPENDISYFSAKGDTLLLNGSWGSPMSFSKNILCYSVDFGATWLLSSSWSPSFTPGIPYQGDLMNYFFNFGSAYKNNDIEGSVIQLKSLSGERYPTLADSYWNFNQVLVGQSMFGDRDPVESYLIDKTTDQLYIFNAAPTLRWWDYPAYWHKPSFGSQTADFATDLGHDGTLFLGSKRNGLWRSTPKILDSVYQASITKHYTSCSKMGIEINGEQYQTGKNFLQPKANPQDPDTLIYVEFVPAIDTSINLVLCHSHYLLYRHKHYYEGNYQEVWPSVDGCDTLANIQVSSMLDTTIVETFYGWHGETMEYGGKVYSFPRTTITDIIYDQNGCDSIKYKLKLRSKTTRETLPIMAACANDTIAYNGMEITESGIYRDTAFTTMGFDSVYYYQPIFFSPSSVKITVTNRFLCAGDTIQINNLLIDIPGSYTTDTIVSDLGCDIDYQVLNVKGVTNQSLKFSVSVGDTVAGVQIWTDTLFTQVISSVEYGCDSLVTEYDVHVVLANEDLSLSKIRFYPNPASDWLRFEHVQDFQRVEIIDLLGESHGSYPIVGASLDIQLEGFSSGMYYAIFHQKRGPIVLKFEVAP